MLIDYIKDNPDNMTSWAKRLSLLTYLNYKEGTTDNFTKSDANENWASKYLNIEKPTNNKGQVDINSSKYGGIQLKFQNTYKYTLNSYSDIILRNASENCVPALDSLYNFFIFASPYSTGETAISGKIIISFIDVRQNREFLLSQLYNNGIKKGKDKQWKLRTIPTNLPESYHLFYEYEIINTTPKIHIHSSHSVYLENSFKEESLKYIRYPSALDLIEQVLDSGIEVIDINHIETIDNTRQSLLVI